jgi:hypothetical protein
MKYIIGAILFPLAIALVYDAWRHRNRFFSARAEAVRHGRPAEHPIAPDSIAALGEIVAPIAMMVLAFVAIKLTVAFFVLDTTEFFSSFDLAGTLTLILAYGIWLKTKTSMRMPQDDQSVENLGYDAASLPGAVVFDGSNVEPLRPRAHVNQVNATAGARVAIPTGPRHGTAVAHDTQPNFEQE